MSKALAWIRKSEGSEDDIGLELQREQVKDRANELADDVDELDLGVHTGFSRLSEDHLPLKDTFIDTNPRVQDALERLRNGEYDYLVALDDTRIARDGYLKVVRHACVKGGCEIEHVEDVPSGMTYAVQRVVELWVKLKEIQKSHKAKQRMKEEGRPDGRAPFGFQYSKDGTELVVDENEFDTALKIIELDEQGESQRGISREIDPSRATVRSVLDDKERYLRAADSVTVEA